MRPPGKPGEPESEDKQNRLLPDKLHLQSDHGHGALQLLLEARRDRQGGGRQCPAAVGLDAGQLDGRRVLLPGRLLAERRRRQRAQSIAGAQDPRSDCEGRGSGEIRHPEVPRCAAFLLRLLLRTREPVRFDAHPVVLRHP